MNSAMRESGSFMPASRETCAVCSTFIANRGEGFAGHFDSSKGMTSFRWHLRFFVALAGEENDVAGPGLADGERDGFAAVGFGHIFCTGLLKADQCVVHDGEWIFGAGIVRGENNEITSLARGFAHNGRLARSRSPPQPKRVMTFPFESGFRDEIAGQRGEIAERVISVRVVHDDGKRLPQSTRSNRPGTCVRRRCPERWSQRGSCAWAAAAAASTL